VSRYNKKLTRYLISLFILALTIFISGFIGIDSTQDSVNLPAMPGYYRVVSVSDGDTIVVNMDGREEKVRLIGVDTPETVKPNSPQECYGKEASNFLKNTLSNQQVKLEPDPINQNRDRYERLLRYVYFNDILINKQIIEQGYGFAYLSFPFTKAEEFRLAQVSARQAGVGVWSGNCQIKNPEGERPKTNEI
jgi:micrococcal nuclease